MTLGRQLAISTPDVQPVCPAEIFRRSLQTVRERRSRLFVCRMYGGCGWPPPDPEDCQSCFVVEPGEQSPWYVLYQRYLHGDA